jgi:hypothetical protein
VLKASTMAGAMVAKVPHPSAVPITMPKTSPMAHPVRQCRVALKAVRLSGSFQMAMYLLPTCRYGIDCIPIGGICKRDDGR